MGATGNVSGTLRIGFRSDMVVRAILAWGRALTDDEAERIAGWGESL